MIKLLVPPLLLTHYVVRHSRTRKIIYDHIWMKQNSNSNQNELIYLNQVLLLPTKQLYIPMKFHLLNYTDLPKMECSETLKCASETLSHNLKDIDIVFNSTIKHIKKLAVNLRTVEFTVFCKKDVCLILVYILLFKNLSILA